MVRYRVAGGMDLKSDRRGAKREEVSERKGDGEGEGKEQEGRKERGREGGREGWISRDLSREDGSSGEVGASTRMHRSSCKDVTRVSPKEY